MALSKETLEKTVVLLQEEIIKIQEKEKEVLTDMRQHLVGNFHVNYIDKRWLGSKDEQQYEISFKHKEREIDLDFRIHNDGSIDRLGWSSWSFSKITKEEIQKSIAYIDAVKEMLIIMSDTSVAQEVIDAVVVLEIEELNPLQTKRYELESELRNVRDEISSIKENEKFEKAIQLFKSDVFFVDYYNLTNRTQIHRARIELKKEKIILYYGHNGTDKKTILKNELLWLYHHATKSLTRQIRNWSINDYADENIYTYTKTDNMFLTAEEANNPVVTTITKEEYETLRGRR